MKNKSKSQGRVSDNPFARNFAEEEAEEDIQMDFESATTSTPKGLKNGDKGDKKKSKKRAKYRESEGVSYDSGWKNGASSLGYQMKEVDMSEIPQHLLSSLVRTNPARSSGVLSVDEINNQEDMEGWIIQCPKSVDLRRILRGRKINLDGSVILHPKEEGDSAYEAVAVPSISGKDKEKNAFLILPNAEEGRFKMASVPLTGYISIRQHIPKVERPDLVIKKKRTRKLPSGIKERHPIYGVDFSQALSNVRVTKSYENTKQRHKKMV